MAIFTNTAVVTEQSQWDQLMDKYPEIEPTAESAMNISYEFAADVHKIIGATYIADLMIETSLAEGATNLGEMIEEAAGESKNKFLTAIKNTFERIAIWFRKVIDRLKSIFSDGKKWYTNNSKDIKDAWDKIGKHYDFKTKGLKFKQQDIDVFSDVRSKSMAISKKLNDLFLNNIKPDKEKKKSIKEEFEKSSEYQFFKEYFEIASKEGEGKNKEYHIEPINDITGPIGIVVHFSKVVDKMNEDYKQMQQYFKAMNDKIKKENDISKLNSSMTMYTYVTRQLQHVHSAELNMYIRLNNKSMAILKGILRAANKVEGQKAETEVVKASATSFNIFESALDLL